MLMNNFYCFICAALFIFQNITAQTQLRDTITIDSIIPSKIFLANVFIASSFINNKNWKGIDNNSLFVTSSTNLSYKKNNTNSSRINELRLELGYQNFFDSAWIKTSDNFFISSIWILNKRQGLKESFSLSLKTQLTDTWDYTILKPDDKPTWKSGPFVPFTFITGYGMNWFFRENSYVNFSFVSIKIYSRPKAENIFLENKIIAKTDKVIFFSDYGFNLQGVLKKKLSLNSSWENKFSFFSKGLEKKTTNFDMQNTFSFFPFHYIKIRFENKITYDFTVSNKLQFRNELLVGFGIEKN